MLEMIPLLCLLMPASAPIECCVDICEAWTLTRCLFFHSFRRHHQHHQFAHAFVASQNIYFTELLGLSLNRGQKDR